MLTRRPVGRGARRGHRANCGVPGNSASPSTTRGSCIPSLMLPKRHQGYTGSVSGSPVRLPARWSAVPRTRAPAANSAATTMSAGGRRPEHRCHNDVRRRTALPQRRSPDRAAPNTAATSMFQGRPAGGRRFPARPIGLPAARPCRGRQAGAASVPAGRLDGPRGNGLGQGGGGHAARRAARFRRELEHGARNAAVPAHPVHLLVYVLVNGFIVIIWAMTSSHGFFWPISRSSAGESASCSMRGMSSGGEVSPRSRSARKSGTFRACGSP